MIKDEAADPQDASELMMIESVDESVLSAPEDIQLESAAIKVEETDETQGQSLKLLPDCWKGCPRCKQRAIIYSFPSPGELNLSTKKTQLAHWVSWEFQPHDD